MHTIVNIGAYAYDPTAGLFSVKIPKAASDPYTLVQVTVTAPSNATYFGRVFNIASYSMTATATAAHRPRDVSLILDYSGSMRFGSLLGIPYTGNRNNGSSSASGSNNPESVYPKFGPYSSTSAGLQWTTATTLGSYQYSPANITESNTYDANRPPIVLDFYQNPPYTDPDIPAFNNTVDSTGPNPPADSSLDADKCAGGDKFLHISNTSSNGYATTVKDVTGGTTKNSAFETLSDTGGYNTYYGVTSQYPSGTKFKGYTQGPRYWGKTFFIWPPEPRYTSGADPTKPSTTDPTKDVNGKYICDWRQRFFIDNSTGVGLKDNTKLWDSSGNWRTPSAGGYTINYNAILAWITSTPNPFPVRLHAGHIQYYSAIPTSINTSSFPRPTSTNDFGRNTSTTAWGWCKPVQRPGRMSAPKWDTATISPGARFKSPHRPPGPGRPT